MTETGRNRQMPSISLERRDLVISYSRADIVVEMAPYRPVFGVFFTGRTDVGFDVLKAVCEDCEPVAMLSTWFVPMKEYAGVVEQLRGVNVRVWLLDPEQLDRHTYLH
jgi:hypothetical protein